MRLSHLAAVAAACSLVAAPAFAAPANRAAKLSLVNEGARGDKAPAPASQDVRGSRLGGAAIGTYLLIAVGLAAVVGGAIALGHNDSSPASM